MYYKKMPASVYEHYKEMVKQIDSYGEKDDLKRLFAEIQTEYGFCEELHDLNKYHRWSNI